MRLLSLHIAAFGGIVNRDITLGEGVTEIMDKNGAGKSTLAAFIKTMLFGLEGEAKKSDITKNEYLLYTPWSGGRFGGSLTFLEGGRTYRIERFYEPTGKTKTPTESLKIFDLERGEETDIFGKCPGRTLFGVDGESFLRTAYLSSRRYPAGKTAAISAKLGGLEEDESDLAAYDRAIKLLNRRRTEIRTYHRQRNGQKLLDLAERQLLEKEAEIDGARAAAASLLLAEEEMKRAKERADVLDAQVRLAEAERDRVLRAETEREQYEKRRAEISEKRAAAEAEAEKWRPRFPCGMPTGALLASLDEQLSERKQLLSLLAEEGGETAPVPEEDVISARRLLRERDGLKTKLYEMKKNAEEVVEKPKGVGHALLFLSLGMLLAGVILLLVLLPLGAALTALGALLLFLWLTHARRTAREEAAAREDERARRERAEALLAETEEAAKAALLALGLSPSDGEEALDRLAATAAERRHRQAEAERRRARLAELNALLAEELAPYPCLPPEPSAAVRDLREACGHLLEAEHAIERELAELRALDGEAKAKERAPSAATANELDSMLLTLRSERDAARERYTEVKAGAERDSERAERLDRLFGERAELLDKVGYYERRLGTLDRTAAFLEGARKALEERTVGGVRRHVERYVERLLDSRHGSPEIGLELALSFRQGGESHSAAYLSTGLAAIAEICLRLALTDELYGENPPPLLLDDPFVHLDEENLARGLALLAELGKERQIVYLTCHPSRSLL